MTLLPGAKLGSHEILDPLGAGGMGEVYRARDTRLQRDVAIKVLPEAFALDADRLARFQREAQLLAALNHPNIGAIYGLEEHHGSKYLVLEYVPGPTLAERLARGPLPPDEALEVIRQLIEALDAAHEKGIVHRDLKPANIKVTPEGQVKVLDFGLAKPVEREPEPADLLTSPTISLAATRAGSVLGTAPYMSPEQARGKPVDKRTDIWAFGCVLYEILTGRQAFTGETASDVMVRILSQEPDWNAVSGKPFERLIRRCLEKDPRRRLRDIGDAQLEQPAAATARSPVFAWRTAGIMAAVVVAASLATWWAVKRLAAPKAPKEKQVLRLTDFPGLEESPALSPDGKSVAFTSEVDGFKQIWLRLLTGGPPLRITRDAADHLEPRWSPDSNSILYYTPPAQADASGMLWEVPALGGSPRRITSAIGGADISHDGRQIAFVRFQNGPELVAAARDGTQTRTVARLERGYRYSNLRWSPDGRRIAYVRSLGLTYGIFVHPTAGGAAREISGESNRISGFAWLPDSSTLLISWSRGSTLYYLPTHNLWTHSVDSSEMRQVTFGEASYEQPDVSYAGGANAAIAANRVRIEFDIWKFPTTASPDENVRRAVRITQQTGSVQTPSVGPGDKEVVYLSDSGGHGNLWIAPVEASRDRKGAEAGEARQITFERHPLSPVGVPVWSPDGKYIAFVKPPAPGDEIGMFLVTPDGSGERLLTKGQAGWADWSADGRWLYYVMMLRDRPNFAVKMAVESGETQTVRTEDLQGLAVAADGKTLYYATPLRTQSGVSDYEIRAASPETEPGRTLARISGRRVPDWQLFHPVLSRDGKQLAILLTDGGFTNLWALPTDGGPMRPLTQFSGRPTFIVRRVSWNSDGRFIFASLGQGDSDIVLLDGVVPQR